MEVIVKVIIVIVAKVEGDWPVDDGGVAAPLLDQGWLSEGTAVSPPAILLTPS
jgi:hypothetical protein